MRPVTPHIPLHNCKVFQACADGVGMCIEVRTVVIRLSRLKSSTIFVRHSIRSVNSVANINFIIMLIIWGTFFSMFCDEKYLAMSVVSLSDKRFVV